MHEKERKNSVFRTLWHRNLIHIKHIIHIDRRITHYIYTYLSSIISGEGDTSLREA